MVASIELWFEYLLRFSHLVAGISWIGSSFYFIWLDSSFVPPEKARHNVDGEVFMVHGGFYYQVEKKKIAPGEIPKTLHWFKWEATLTWVTGFLLFIVLYWLKGASLLINPEVAMSQTQAIVISFAMMVAAWFIYDGIWHPRFMKSALVNNLLSLAFVAYLIYLSMQLFSGRGAFILIGAIFGTMMVLNVWVRILPGQRKMLAQAEKGETPDYSIGLKSKVRSVHNTYFIFPVLFIMISNHYPSVYNHQQNWLLLIVLAVSGALFRHAMVTKKAVERLTALPAAIGLIVLVYMTAVKSEAHVLSRNVTDLEVREIVDMRCVSCHSTNNTDEVFTVAQKGLILESNEQLKLHKDKIIFQVVTHKIMPLANKTQMTEDERKILHKWLIQ